MKERNDNNLSTDSYDRRSARLRLLSANIGKYASELNLPAEIENWAVEASETWDNKLVFSGVEGGEQQVGFETFQRLLKELQQNFVILKKLLLAKIKYLRVGDEVIEEYGLHKQAPTLRGTLKDAVEKMAEVSDRLRAAGDPRVLTEKMITDLKQKCEKMNQSWHDAHSEKQQSVKAHKALRQLFNEDSIRLRYVLTVAQFAWGKFGVQLKELGFSNVNRYHSLGQTKPPTNLTFDLQKPVLNISWKPVTGATSYQLACSSDEKKWEALFKGKVSSYSYEPQAGKLFYRVRARNIRGYSKWSETGSIEISD